MKKFLKRKFVLVLSVVMLLAVLFVGNALAGGGSTRYFSPEMGFSGTGWGGWSCPAGTFVVGGGYLPSSHTVNVSEAAKPGSTSGLYPVYPHYTYTPPEEGWVVQNGGQAAPLQIYVDCASAPEVLPEYICHATGSPTNPFNMNSPSNIGQLMGHVGLGHQDGEDIIPPVPVFLPLGQNWDTEGQAIWENGCEVPEPHDYELVFDYRNECEGDNYYRIMLTDFGQYVTTLYHSGFFVWSEPFLLESRTFGPFDLGEHGTFPAVTLDEPTDCQVVHELAFVHTKDCVGWSYGYVLDGVETIIASGEWVDLLEQEKIFVSFEVFLPAGEIATRTPIFGPWYLVEPAGCHDITIKSHQAADCDGYARAVNLYDLGVYQGHLLFESGVFTDPYTVEPGLPAVSFAIPSEYGGGTVDFDALSEPTDCQILRTYKAHQAYLKDNCEGIQRVINLYEGPASDPYATLVGTFYNETVPFVDPLVLETIPAVTVDVPAIYGSDHTFAAMDEPEFCYSTCASDVFSRSWTEEILTPEGAVQVTTFFEYVDSLDPEVVCRVTEEVEIVYESCLNAESTYEVPGEWTAWYALNGPNKERSRVVEVFDGRTDFKCGEYTDYDQECFADDFIWVWRGCGCSIRDRTYALYQFGSPPLNAQRAYCGCDFSCSFEGAWNDSGYVNNCQGADYTHWDELPKWCGFTSCE